MEWLAGLFARGGGAKAGPRRVLALVVAGVSLAGASCGGPVGSHSGPGAGFARGEIQIASAADTFVMEVEIAATARQRQLGLSRRATLPESEGMIFLFDQEQPPGRSFWMYRTAIPLSVAFLDGEGVIREIRQMRPCRSPIPFFCPAYRARVPFHAALEVSRGYFERRGIAVGDRVLLPPRRDTAAPGVSRSSTARPEMPSAPR